MGNYNITGENIVSLEEKRKDKMIKQMEAEVNYLRGYLDGLAYFMEKTKGVENGSDQAGRSAGDAVEW